MPTKPGDGGHGMEEYNPENGQYIDEERTAMNLMGLEKGKKFGSKRAQIEPFVDDIENKSTKQFYDELGNKALKCIKDETGYNDEEANTFYHELVEYMGGNYFEYSMGENKQGIEIINNGLSRMGAYDGAIYRGMEFDDFKEYKKFLCLEVGEILPTLGLTSWSSDKEVALTFANYEDETPYSVVLKCENNKSAVGVQHLSKWGKTESEVLAPSTAKYVVTKKFYLKRPNGLKSLLIIVEEVQEDGKE